MTSPKAVADHLAKFSTQAERSRLDEQPHFIPINLSVLNLTLGKVIVQNVEDIYDAEAIAAAKAAGIDLYSDQVISLQELKNKLETYVSGRHKNKIELTTGKILVNGKVNDSISDIIQNYLPATVYSGGEIVGALYGSYKKAYSGFFKKFLNKEISKFINKTLYKDSNYKVGFDVGHIFGNTELANTPLGQKLRKVLDTLSGLTEGSLNIEGVNPQYISQNKSSIVSLKTEIDSILNRLATGSSYGPKIEAEIKKDVNLNNILVRLKANIVIAQDRYENQAVYASLLEGPLGNELIALLEKVNFSNNLIEQIGENIAFTIAGKKIVSSKKSIPIKKSVAKKPIKANLVAKKADQNMSVRNLPKYRTKAITSNLVQLQNLINASLVERVKANMGRGERRDVLNLRTGRFAESVKVERMSQSREGMITAFYSYMRNPYATFSQGGRQQSPKSRDPKLLIAKSIREIATQQVANRLRSVNI